MCGPRIRRDHPRSTGPALWIDVSLGTSSRSRMVYSSCGARQDSLRRSALHDAALVQDDDLLGDAPHERQVVRDEQQAQAALLLQAAQQLDDGGLDRDVERRGRPRRRRGARARPPAPARWPRAGARRR